MHQNSHNCCNCYASYESIFITVGTTEFDELIEEIDTEEFLDLLVSTCCCKRLVLQIGRGSIEPLLIPKLCLAKNIKYELFRFKQTLHDEIEQADLVISHCGAGSILEVLHMNKSLIVVINHTLQGNHQTELADALTDSHYCLTAVPKIDSIRNALQQMCQEENQIVTFPKPNVSIFPQAVGELFDF